MFCSQCRATAMLVLVVLVTGTARAAGQQVTFSGTEDSLPLRLRPMVYVDIVPNPPVKRHTFWDRTNVGLFSGIGITRTLDYTSTTNMQKRGREEILLPDDVVSNRAGFAALEAAAAGASVGISYLLHRSGHHKLERWLSIGHISVTGFGDVRNYSLESKHSGR